MNVNLGNVITGEGDAFTENKYGTVEYESVGHDKQGSVNSTLSGLGELTIGGEQQDLAKLDDLGINTDADNIITITKDESWEESFKVDLINVGVAAEQVENLVNVVESFTAKVPDHVKAMGPNAEDVYRRAIANGMGDDNLDAYVNSSDFDRVVELRNDLARDYENGTATAENVYARLAGEALTFAESYIEKNCASSYLSEVCGGVLDAVGKSVEDLDRGDIITMLEKFSGLMELAKSEGDTGAFTHWQGMFLEAMKCASAWDREQTDTVFNDYAQNSVDKYGANVESGGDKYDLALIKTEETAEHIYYQYENGLVSKEDALSMLNAYGEDVADYYKNYYGTGPVGLSSISTEGYLSQVAEAIETDDSSKFEEANLYQGELKISPVASLGNCILSPLHTAVCTAGSAAGRLEDGDYLGAGLEVASLGLGGKYGTIADIALGAKDGDPTAVILSSAGLGAKPGGIVFGPNKGGGSGFTVKKPAPEGWKAEPPNKGLGIRYRDPNNPHNEIRFSDAKNTTNPAQQQPYVTVKKNGAYYDKDGNKLDSGKLPEAHISLDDYNPDLFGDDFWKK